MQNHTSRTILSTFLHSMNLYIINLLTLAIGPAVYIPPISSSPFVTLFLLSQYLPSLVRNRLLYDAEFSRD